MQFDQVRQGGIEGSHQLPAPVDPSAGLGIKKTLRRLFGYRDADGEEGRGLLTPSLSEEEKHIKRVLTWIETVFVFLTMCLRFIFMDLYATVLVGLKVAIQIWAVSAAL